MSEPVKLLWGHPVKTPDGREIRLPSGAIKQLKRLGLLIRQDGPPKMSAFVFTLLQAEYDALTAGLRQVLGPALDGPQVVRCSCSTCRHRADLLQKELDHVRLFELDMAVQRSAQ